MPDETFRRISRHLHAIKIMMAINIALTFAAFCKLVIFAG
jgi:hypothetical protein